MYVNIIINFKNESKIEFKNLQESAFCFLKSAKNLTGQIWKNSAN